MTTSSGRRSWLYGGVAALAAGAGLGGAWWAERKPSGGTDRVDAAFWARTFARPEGGELKLADFQGKALMINFWATWCPPCVEELPMIDRFFKDHVGNGWHVVGLAIDQPSAVRKFLERTPVSFPIGLAGLDGTDLIKQMGNTSGGLPFTLVVNADGQVAARKLGKLDSGDLESWRRG